MLPISWNGSNGAVHFLVTAARKSFTVWACTPVTISASAHSAAAARSLLMVASPFDCIVLVRSHVAWVSSAASYVAAVAAGNRSRPAIFFAGCGIDAVSYTHL